jgi:hypothetical protein
LWFILAMLFLAAELKPPTNINITTSGNNVTVTWTLPGESEGKTYLGFYLSGNMHVEVKYYNYILLTSNPKCFLHPFRPSFFGISTLHVQSILLTRRQGNCK